MDTKLWSFKKLGCPTRVERTNQVETKNPEKHVGFFQKIWTRY